MPRKTAKAILNYKIETVDSSLLEVLREDYQKPLNEKRVAQIVAAFDENIANEPKVSYRDGHYRCKQPIRFHLRTHPCGRSYPARLGHCSGRSQLPVPRPVSAFQRFPDSGRWRNHYVCQRNSQPHRGLTGFRKRGGQQKAAPKGGVTNVG